MYTNKVTVAYFNDNKKYFDKCSFSPALSVGPVYEILFYQCN